MRIAFSTLHPNALLPRNPLLRALLLVAGMMILVGLLAFGLIAGLAFLTVGVVALLVRKLLPGKVTRSYVGGVAPEGVIEGEFRVVDPATNHSLPRAKIG